MNTIYSSSKNVAHISYGSPYYYMFYLNSVTLSVV